MPSPQVAAKQEPKGLSLHHRLEGENRPNRNSPNRGKEIREEPRRHNKVVKSCATKPCRAAQRSRAPELRKEAAKSRTTKPRRGAKKRRKPKHGLRNHTQHKLEHGSRNVDTNRCESKQTSDTIRNRPDLSLRGCVENQAQKWSSV